MNRRRLAGVGLILLSAAGFGSGSLFAQPVYGAGVGWLVLSAWRFGLGALLTWAWILASSDRRLGLAALDRRSVFAALALGVMYVGNSGTYYAGLETVSPSLAALIVFIYPALVAVLSLRFGRRLEGRRAWVALGIALLGVTLSVGGIDPNQRPPIGGLALVIASPIIYSLWIVLSARLSGERPGIVGDAAEGRTSVPATAALMMSATAIVFWSGALVAGEPVLPETIPSEAWFGITGVGVFSTFVAIQAFSAGTKLIGAAQASLISTVEPVWTIVLAVILFGVGLTQLQLLGGLMILGAVLITQTGPQPDDSRRPVVRLADE